MAEVSVVIPSYNGATRGYIAPAIESVLAQDFSDFELIVVDDGSTDDTCDAISKYASDHRVRVARQNNGGLAAARNAGVAFATGKYVCFLDDDDLWKPGKLSAQLAHFRRVQDPKLAMVFTAIELIDPKGNVIGLQSHRVFGNAYRDLFYENVVDSPSSVMVRRDILEGVGGFRADGAFGKVQGCEDRALWIRIARSYHIMSIDEPLVSYRVHPAQMSGSHREMEQHEASILFHAIVEATPEIVRESDRIFANMYTKFAHKHFSLGNYAEFRRNVGLAAGHARIQPGLLGRYILSFVPFLVKGLRVLRKEH